MPRSRLIAGIMSGSSVDGVDIALVRIDATEQIALVGAAGYAFEPVLRASILAAAEPAGGDTHAVATLHFALAATYARAVDETLTSAGIDRADLDLIGCHGQTVAHWPNDVVPATLQLGSGPALAALSGVPVVHDFRAADVALGGQGAPLMPWVDWRLFADAARSRPIGVLNLGGIANITLLPRGISEPSTLLAFDTGPANMVIDGLMRHYFGEPLDQDGQVAARGRVNQFLLDAALGHEFFHRPLPRSAGREEFGDAFVTWMRERGTALGLVASDLVATATALSAVAVARSIAHTPNEWHPQEIVIGGGGAHNATLVHALEAATPGVTLSTHERHGWPSDFKEALGFALLADAAVRGEPTALPNVTGVREPLVVGTIAPGRQPRVWPDWIAR